MINRDNLKIRNIPIVGARGPKKGLLGSSVGIGASHTEEGVHPRRGDEEAKGF